MPVDIEYTTEWSEDEIQEKLLDDTEGMLCNHNKYINIFIYVLCKLRTAKFHSGYNSVEDWNGNGTASIVKLGMGAIMRNKEASTKVPFVVFVRSI